MKELFLLYHKMGDLSGPQLQALRKEFGDDISFVSIFPQNLESYMRYCARSTAIAVHLQPSKLPLIPNGIALQMLPHVRFSYPSRASGQVLEQVTEIVIKARDRIVHRTGQPVS